MSHIFAHWRDSLLSLLNRFEAYRKATPFFLAKAYGFFVALNLGCFWWALVTAYPKKIFGVEGLEIFLMQFPVGLLGGLFDFLSLFITLFIAKRAIKSNNNFAYIGYLSIDLVIAGLATLWLLFVFTISGWFVNLVLSLPETFVDRTNLYNGRVHRAFFNPFAPENIKNIYFGILMGASAMLPTLIHGFHALKAIGRKLGPA
ncbi:MAG: hypothetical protein ACKVJQ_06115 [Alphaproteobacteria bacterium]|jgi:hypothetical protein